MLHLPTPLPATVQVYEDERPAMLEDFELGFHVQLTDARRHLLEMRGRVQEDARAEIHGAAVEAAEPGPQRLDVLEPHERRHEIGTRTPTRRV